MKAMRTCVFIIYCFAPLFLVAAELSDIRKKAEQGDCHAQNELGVVYQNGLKGVPADQGEAIKWFKKSAEGGNVTAQSNLGHMYCAGKGVPKDEVEGAKWLLKAAQQGQNNAQFNIGKCYWYGTGVAIDLVEAYKWFLLSAAQDNILSKWCIEELEPKLSEAQLEEGKRRARVYSPKRGILPEPSPVFFEVKFDADPNGKASWQIGFREFSGKLVRTTSREVYLKVLAAKISYIEAASRVDLHVLYGEGSSEEKYSRYIELLKASRIAKSELGDLIKQYGN